MLIANCRLGRLPENEPTLMNPTELKQRTKEFALRVMKLVDALPHTRSGNAIGAQLIRSGTSVGANYRASCRARSKAEFIAKIGVVEEEADESAFWMELITDGGLLAARKVSALLQEANELTAIMAASRISASRRR
jgi:four helix bundle protein